MIQRVCALGISALATVVGIGVAGAPAGAATPEDRPTFASAAAAMGKAGDVCSGSHKMVDAGATGIPPRIYQHRDYETQYKNCASGPVSARVDIAFYADTPCMTVQPGQTVVFKYRVTWLASASPAPGPRNVVTC